MLLTLAALCPWAGEALADTAKKSTEIHITADTLVSDRDARYAEFQGNVTAIQDGSTLTSDRLKITYTDRNDASANERSADDGKGSDPARGIETIVAAGAVKMVMEDKTAWAETAVFNRKDDTVTLSGGSPKVVSGKSTITGETIIMNRTTGKVTVHGGTNQRVEAFFYEEDAEKAGDARRRPSDSGQSDAK